MWCSYIITIENIKQLYIFLYLENILLTIHILVILVAVGALRGGLVVQLSIYQAYDNVLPTHRTERKS